MKLILRVKFNTSVTRGNAEFVSPSTTVREYLADKQRNPAANYFVNGRCLTESEWNKPLAKFGECINICEIVKCYGNPSYVPSAKPQRREPRIKRIIKKIKYSLLQSIVAGL